MQQFNLGDYKGGRENLGQILSYEAPQYQKAVAMSSAIGGIAEQLAMGRQAQSELLGMKLAMQNAASQSAHAGRMDELAYARSTAGDKEASALKQLGEEMEGYNQGALDWANNVLQSRNPDDPDYKQALRTIKMLEGRPKGSPSRNKGYSAFMGEHNVYDPFAQGQLGRAAAQKQKPAENKKPIFNNGNYRDIDNDLHS
jgi:hypothetical protein